MNRDQLNTANGPRLLRGAILHRGGRLLAAVSFLPLIILSPLGAGTIVIHAHHERTLHAHKVITRGGPAGARETAQAPNNHGHEEGDTEEHSGIRFILALSHLPRLSASFSTQDLTPKATFAVAAHTTMSEVVLAATHSAFPATTGCAGSLRAHDTLTNLLLGSNSLLI